MSCWSAWRSFLNDQSRKRWFVVSLVIFSMAVVLASYGAFRRAQVLVCEDPGRGIAFEVPGNWEIKYYERNGTYHLDRRRLFKRPTRTIVMWISSSSTEAFEPDEMPPDLEELMENKMERWRRGRDSFTLVQATNIVDRGGHRIATATVQVSRLNDPENAWWQEKEMLLVDLYLISTVRDDEPEHNLRLASVSVIRRNSARVNAEAEEIVNSIRFIEINDELFGGSHLVCRYRKLALLQE